MARHKQVKRCDEEDGWRKWPWPSWSYHTSLIFTHIEILHPDLPKGGKHDFPTSGYRQKIEMLK